MSQQDVKTEATADTSAASSSAGQGEQAALQVTPASQDTGVQSILHPHLPNWPTSKPGPRATPPPAGMRPTNAFRSEQVAEIGYDQSTGEPGVDSLERSLPDEAQTGPVSFDQKPKTAQEALGKRKQRL